MSDFCVGMPLNNRAQRTLVRLREVQILRGRGLKYSDVGRQLGVSATYARSLAKKAMWVSEHMPDEFYEPEIDELLRSENAQQYISQLAAKYAGIPESG